MSNFTDILKHGKKRFKVKNNKGEYGKCEYCDNRYLLFSYKDNNDEKWILCEECIDVFVEEEG